MWLWVIGEEDYGLTVGEVISGAAFARISPTTLVPGPTFPPPGFCGQGLQL